MPPVTGSRPESLLAILGSSDVADFGAEVVIEAVGVAAAARKMVDGMVDVAALQSASQINGEFGRIGGECTSQRPRGYCAW